MMKNKADFSLKQLFALLIGNVLEWLDYSLIGLLSPVISTYFFASYLKRPYEQLMPLTIFSLGIATRPIAAFIFGYFGDHFGRKISLLLSMLLIVICLLSISLLPIGPDLGIVTLLLFIIFNVLSGISFGAEQPLAITLFFESSCPSKKLFYCSLIYCAGLTGMILGNIDVLFSSHNYHNFSPLWRLPFFIAGILGIIAFFYRRFLHESPAFVHLHKSNALVKNPLRSVLTTYIKPTLLCSIISIFETVAFNILFVLSTTYQLDIIQRPGSQVIYGNLLILTSTALTIYLIGKFKKIERPYYHLLLSILMMLICIFPLFYGLLHQDPFLYFASQSCLGILLGSFLSPFPYVLAKMFPTYVRCSGIAISYNITIAIFGGTAPLISLLLYQKTHWIYIPAAYIFVAGSISLLTLILGRKYFLACIEQHHLN